ncbi:cation:proton antiporter [Polymorphum gilvum]|uniref:Transporter, CPA2 family n=1 Tax=Polymorphum gilvum (strain LMG 25793 / CGMCC 1.9160 / SL003B-26A1) TaxID=991905 RepID=F2IW46_POLGS|nr:cation:proton antiporter [Polymorphum gilvum]ADZ71431.1 Transporter, CPA2 family [Polymorphum gilvum SL003B-26A1]
MDTPIIVAAFAGLLVVISLLQPLARRLGLAPSVLLAGVGTLIGLLAAFLLYTPTTDAFNELAMVFVNLPFDSQKILYIFLPVLLFQSTLTLDVRRIFEDIGAILVMAVVAVVVATAFIGLALYPLAGVPLVACLLLGAIVATTDPVAVVAIFRDIGAPARLGRLVEGESLLNDAAAIVLFVLLLGMLTSQQTPDAVEAVVTFLRSFAGGIVVGALFARLFVMLLPLMREQKLAQVTLSLALPYLVYVVSEQSADVSAVVAVVAAGIVFNLYGPARVAPAAWSYLHDVWEQIAFWASSLIFVLASILIPELLAGFKLLDILLLVVLIVAALAARAVVIFGLLPVLGVLRIGEAVSNRYKTVILWGGMRGAVTLTLALSVTEHPSLSEDVQHFIAVLATGFVLFTLLVYGTTLKRLIRALKLNTLTPLDIAMRKQFLALALSDVREAVDDAARDYNIAPEVAEKLSTNYSSQASTAVEDNVLAEEIMDRERVVLGLVALADRERVLILRHFHEGTVSNRTIASHLTLAGRIADQTRSKGRVGYNRAARSALAYGPTFRFAQWLQRHLKIDGLLSVMVADRFERLLIGRIVIKELIEFNDERIRPLLGERVAGILHETLAIRREDNLRGLEGLQLQYPDYAQALEYEFLRRTGLRLEEQAYSEAFTQKLIGSELYNDLQRSVSTARDRTRVRPRLDLGLKTRDLVDGHPLFADLPDTRREAIARLMRPYFAVPGETLIRKGEKGDAAYFISSGAVEVRTPHGPLRLGRGDVFGEMALLSGKPRTADVAALGYCQLLVLGAGDFRALMKQSPDIAENMARIARQREEMNVPDATSEHVPPAALDVAP